MNNVADHNAVISSRMRVASRQQFLALAQRFSTKHSVASRGVTLVVTILLVALVALVAGVGAFYYLASSGNTMNQGHSTSTLTSHSQTTTGLIRSSETGSRGSTSSAHRSTSTSSLSSMTIHTSSSSGTGVTRYSGVFNYSVAIGPTGERVFENGTFQTYNSVQKASGSFTFFISTTNGSGTGSGSGTLTVTTSGFCLGSVTVPYTFEIPDATVLLGGNITIFFGTPTPASVMVPLSCSGPMNGVDTSINNPLTFLSVYPNEISSASVPVYVSEHLSGNISYAYSIAQAR